jgi:hypothetical protein
MASLANPVGHRFSALVLLLLPFTITTQAQVRMVPNGELGIAYRQLTDGKLSEAVFQTWLECWNGECTLTTLTLGQCMFGVFYPKVQRWTTRESLSVDLIAPGVLLAEFKESGATFQMRFTYELREGMMVHRLKAFSGGVVKQSAVVEKVITWELVPLRFSESVVQFGCKASLDFVEE